MKRHWFFDLDGTLADTDPDIRVAWKAALADLGVSCPGFDSGFVAGPPIEEMARRLLPDRATDAFCAALRERFGFHYDHDGFPNTAEYPGVLDAVRRLKAAGARVFIVTNKRYAGARAMARHFGWDRLFDGVYAGDMFKENPAVGKLRKPELLAYVLGALGAAPDDAVMVGDTENDFEAAARNGIESVAVAWGYGTPEERARASRVARTPADL